MRNNDAPDHVVTKDEWAEYYNNVSASIDRDDYFAVMMNNAWNLDGTRTKKKGWGSDKDKDQKPSAGQFSPSKGLDGTGLGSTRDSMKAESKVKEEKPMN